MLFQVSADISSIFRLVWRFYIWKHMDTGNRRVKQRHERVLLEAQSVGREDKKLVVYSEPNVS